MIQPSAGSFFGRAGFDLNESTQIYTQVMWADYQADRQLAATPVTGVYVQPDNPNLSPEVAALLATRPDPDAPFSFRKRMIESGPRIASNDYEVVQLLVGPNGAVPFAFAEDWSCHFVDRSRHVRIAMLRPPIQSRDVERQLLLRFLRPVAGHGHHDQRAGSLS